MSQHKQRWGRGWLEEHSESSRVVIRRQVLSNGTKDQLLNYIKGSCRPVSMDYYRFSYSQSHGSSEEWEIINDVHLRDTTKAATELHREPLIVFILRLLPYFNSYVLMTDIQYHIFLLNGLQQWRHICPGMITPMHYDADPIWRDSIQLESSCCF